MDPSGALGGPRGRVRSAGRASGSSERAAGPAPSARPVPPAGQPEDGPERTVGRGSSLQTGGEGSRVNASGRKASRDDRPVDDSARPPGPADREARRDTQGRPGRQRADPAAVPDRSCRFRPLTDRPGGTVHVEPHRAPRAGGSCRRSGSRLPVPPAHGPTGRHGPPGSGPRAPRAGGSCRRAVSRLRVPPARPGAAVCPRRPGVASSGAGTVPTGIAPQPRVRARERHPCGIGSRTWQLRTTASSGSTAR